MNFLSIFVLIPVLMIIALFIARNRKPGPGCDGYRQHTAGDYGRYLTVSYITDRGRATGPMLYTASMMWYEPLNIHYSVGVDGISVAMLLPFSYHRIHRHLHILKMEPLTKGNSSCGSACSPSEYSVSLLPPTFSPCLCSYEVALIPMFLLIGIWEVAGGRNTQPWNRHTDADGCFGIPAGGILAFISVVVPPPWTFWNSLKYTFLYSNNICSSCSLSSVLVCWELISLPHLVTRRSCIGQRRYPCFTQEYWWNWVVTWHFVYPFTWCRKQHDISWIFLIMTGIGVVYGAFSAIHQTDLKYINAYSSVSHCNLVLFAILMLNQTAMTGAVLQMLSHGLMTALSLL